ncbi:MATE family efflux transporter [Anaerosinus sp.]|uniref:MATE family efflux transporter n=1 Tax=Selenobaculum sp. TaxID=3074374 RepID=UPI003AB1F33B
MRQTYSYKEKVKQFMIVLLPIFITQITLMSTGFFDTVMAGNVSEYDLAGVAIAVNIFMPVFGSILGVLSGLTPTISQLYGANKKEELPFIIVQGIYLAIVIAICLIILGFIVIDPLLNVMNLEAKVKIVAKGFLLACAFGISPILIAAVFRNFVDALGYTRVTMVVTVCAVPINICMNYLFIFGKMGFPALGGIGAGVGTAITYWFVLFINLLVIKHVKPFSQYDIFRFFGKPDFAAWRQLLSIGIPIGFAMFCEQSIFGAVALFMAAYGTTVIAAHQAAMNFSTMVYMIPLSISMALTIMVGYEVGAKRYKDAKKYSYLGVALSILFSGSLTLILANFKGEIAALYTKDEAVYQMIQIFLLYVIVLQFSDAISAPLQGALRGYKDVKITLILAVISYWIIGLPVGYAFANYLGVGPYGYWVGLIAGIVAGAVALIIRLVKVQRKQLVK